MASPRLLLSLLTLLPALTTTLARPLPFPLLKADGGLVAHGRDLVESDLLDPLGGLGLGSGSGAGAAAGLGAVLGDGLLPLDSLSQPLGESGPVGPLGDLVGGDDTDPFHTANFLHPVGDAVKPLTQGVAPVLGTVTDALHPLTDDLAPVTDLLAPVTDTLKPVTDLVHAPLAVLGLDIDLLSPTDLLCAKVDTELLGKVYALGCVCLGDDGLLLTAKAEVDADAVEPIKAEVGDTSPPRAQHIGFRPAY